MPIAVRSDTSPHSGAASITALPLGTVPEKIYPACAAARFHSAESVQGYASVNAPDSMVAMLSDAVIRIFASEVKYTAPLITNAPRSRCTMVSPSATPSFSCSVDPISSFAPNMQPPLFHCPASLASSSTHSAHSTQPGVSALSAPSVIVKDAM